MKKPFIPDGKKSNAKFQLKYFLGVDFSTHESEVANRRSPDSVNMISGKSGSMDKRLGYAIEHLFTGKIWAITNIKTFVYTTDTPSVKIDIDVLVVHAGTKLWAYNPYLDAWQEARSYSTSGFSTLTLQERETNFIEYSNQNYFTLIHNNWITTKSDLLVLFCSGSTLVGYEGTINCDVYVNDVIGQFLYYPTTSIGRSPTGLTSTPFEQPNNLVNIRKNSFLSDASNTTFLLDYEGNTYTMGVVEQMQSNGKFTTTLHDASNATITVTYNNANHTITFSAVPHATYKAGVDNIRVQFYTDQSTLKITNKMNDYFSYANHGIKGLNNIIFFCDYIESKFRNKEIWVTVKKHESDSVEIRLYLDANNYSNLGSNRKLGYSKLGEYLILHGEREGNSPVAYLKNVTLDDKGELIVTNSPTTSQIGALSSRSFANLRDDPLFLAESGITAIMIDRFTNIQSMQDRGFYINKQLLSEPNLDKAIAFIFDNKYFISVNGHLYVADVRNKFSEKLAYSESYQYDWFYWEGLDIQSYEVVNGTLYFGTTDGRLCKFKTSSDAHAYEDEIIGTETTWANATNYVVGQLVKDSGTPIKYYICLKAHTSDLTVRSLTNETYWNEITKGTDHFYVPVLAYWTTPILNMDNITAKKTLRNLWVRLPKYAFTGVRIYYASKGLVKQQFDGIFDFSTLDFSRLSFSTDTDPMVVVTNTKQSKFMSIQFKIESRDNTPMSLLEIVGEYTTNGKFKG